MDRLILAILLLGGLITLGVAITLLKHHPLRKKLGFSSPPQKSYKKYSPVPTQVDRNLEISENTATPLTPRSIWVFTSEKCRTCPGVLKLVRRLESDEVSVVEFEAKRNGDVHNLYQIDSVPLTLIVNENGGVEHWFFGPVDLNEIRNSI